MILSYIFPARIPAWILFWGVILDCIDFSNADGGFTDGLFTDELSMFNEDIDPFRSINTYSLNSMSPDVVSSMNFNDENSDADSGAYADPDSDSYSESDPDLFASSAADSNSNSIVDTTTNKIAAECSSYINDDNVLHKNKKARVRLRRETACRNPDSNPDIPTLSLPTLEDPLRPKTDREQVNQDKMNDYILGSGPLLRGANMVLKTCPPDEQRVCSSGNRRDIHRETEGGGYTLTSSTAGKCSQIFMSMSNTKHMNRALHVLMFCRRRIVGGWDACFLLQWAFCCKFYITAIEVAEECQPFDGLPL